MSPATRDQVPGAHLAAVLPRKRWMSGPFVRLLATNAAFGFSVSCFYLLPKHLTVSYQASPGQVGAAVGIFGLISVLVLPWLPRVVSTLGLPRTLCFAQLLMAMSGFAFASLHGVGASMMVLRAVQGLAAAGVVTAGVAMVCELAPAQRLGQAMGLAGAASLIMNAIAPAVAEPIGARYGFAWVFAMSGAAALLGAVVARRLPRSAPMVGASSRPAFPRQAYAVLFAMAITAAGFYVVMAFLAPLALSRGIGAVGGFFVAYTSAALAMRTVGAAFTDRLGLDRTAKLGILAYGASIAAIAAVGPRSLAWLGLGFGLAHGALFPALMGLLFDGIPIEERTRLAAYSNGVMNLGMLTVLGFGQLANRAGLAAVFVVTGVLVAGSALVLVYDRVRNPEALASAVELPSGE